MRRRAIDVEYPAGNDSHPMQASSALSAVTTIIGDWERHPKMARMMRVPKHWSLAQRLEHDSMVEPNSGCRLGWASKSEFGHGRLNYGRKPSQAHRAAWICAHGPIPPGMLVCHRRIVRRGVEFVAEVVAVNRKKEAA